MRVRKAIIPAAGLGTRFLPATKAMPKEMLPIIDKPTIQYIVEEAVQSGIEDIIIVTGKGKRAIEDHFDTSYELEQFLIRKEKLDLLQEVKKPSELADIHYIRQKEPKGLGHAIWSARKFIGKEAFAILLGDIFLNVEDPCLADMIQLANDYKASVIGVQPVAIEEVSRYGIIAGDEIRDRIYQITQLVEKPKADEAPSNLAIVGRYILTPQIFDILDEQKPGVGGEIQLTDAISKLNEIEKVYAYTIKGPSYDVGDKLGFIQTTIQMALQREDLRNEVLTFLRNLLEKEEYRM